MPGTIYTRTGSENDPAGRLADFARFAVQELDDLYTSAAHKPGFPGVRAYMRDAQHALVAIGNMLEGYTTADD